MILESLENLSNQHLHNNKSVRSSDNEIYLINFFQSFCVFKIMLETSFLLFFSDYLIHPSIQIKLQLWKKYRSWKNFEELTIEDLKACNNLIKNWNNHFENINALLINVLCDLSSNIVFLLGIHFSITEHFENINFFVCIINMILTSICIIPLVNSIFQILMQGRSSLFVGFFDKLQEEISLFEGVLVVHQIRFWMIAQNEIKCNMKLKANCLLDKKKLKHNIYKIISDVGTNIDIIIDTAITS